MPRKFLLVLSFLLLLFLVACGESEPAEAPTSDALSGQSAAQETQAAIRRQDAATITAIFATSYANELPTAVGDAPQRLPTRVPTEFRVQATQTSQRATEYILYSPTPKPTQAPIHTATPTVDPYVSYDILGNTVYDQDWLNTTFQGYQEVNYEEARAVMETYRLSDFAGQVVVVHLMTTDCQPCQDLQLNIKEWARQSRDEGRGFNTVYITLDTNPSTAEMDLLMWAESLGLNNFSSDDLTWIIGKASEDMLRTINDTFGENSLEPSNLTLIFIDKLQRSHVSNQAGIFTLDGSPTEATPNAYIGLLSSSQIRDLVIYYNEIGNEEFFDNRAGNEFSFTPEPTEDLNE